VILVALKEGHAPTAGYVRKLREVLPAAFPEVTFYFQAADMVTQILNFGLPAQIDVRTVGRDRATNLRVTQELRRRIAAIPGIVDAHLQQEIDGPAFMAAIDRARALQFGLNAQGIANDLNISLSSSAQVTPNFWTDPASGIPYYITVQTPQHQVSSLGELGNTPVSTKISSTGSPVPGLLSNVARLSRDSVPTNLNQTNIQPAYDVYASVQGRDLGGVSGDINRIVAELKKELKPGNSIEVRGQIQSMHDSQESWAGITVRRRLGLSAHARELPELRRPVRRHPGPSGDAVRNRHDAVHHRHELECTLLDGRHHVSWRCLGEFDSARDLRTGTAARRQDGV
jgi:multidrug efflux pump subunit AcrB